MKNTNKCICYLSGLLFCTIVPKAKQNTPLYHELLPSQTHSVGAALDEQGGGALRSVEVRQDDLGLGLVHDAQEVSSVLPQQEDVLLGGDIQLTAHYTACDL